MGELAMLDMLMKVLGGGGGGASMMGGLQGALNAAPDSMARQQQQQGGGGGLGMAPQPAPAPGMFGGSVPAGNGGMSGPLPGLGGFGAMPSESGNFNMIFRGGMGGGGMPGGGAPMQAGMQGGQGLQQMLPMLLKLFGG